MEEFQEVLACYAELALVLARMVELARERQWEPLPRLDARCTSLYQRLKGMQPEPASTLDRARVLSLASRIRADQDELSALVRPQFQHLVRRMAQLQHAS
jgi:hypothetical protein